jgi:hypothetical protein
MTEAEIRAVVIEFGRLQRGGRLGKKYIRDNKNTPATHDYDRGHGGGTPTRVASGGSTDRSVDRGSFRGSIEQDGTHKLHGFISGFSSYRFGTSGTSVSIRPGIVELESSLQRSFSRTERSHLDFRAQFLNLPNDPTFS